ncbi:MAG: hypothetical protein V7K77_20585 [Nostoc sp.]|uniref:hypothetical protein n=1 Tax=Nostoc sp. TaxID=1180 RepID=UPI002FF80459
MCVQISTTNIKTLYIPEQLSVTEEAEGQFLHLAGGASPDLEPWSGAEHGYEREQRLVGAA